MTDSHTGAGAIDQWLDDAAGRRTRAVSSVATRDVPLDRHFPG
jgi:hypothetical protein